MCLFPQPARLDDLSGRLKFDHHGNFKIPCGKCSECISKRALEWATRARHEISCHRENSFITLTYDNDNLPSIFLVKIEFQKFLKRLRKKLKRPIRYMVSHEYGSRTFRPHHHFILFGYNPSNQIFLKKTSKGESLFTSPEINSLWNKGFHSIGTANERTAYYIASYSLKGKKHNLTDPITGELVTVSDCMDVSKRPAIGYNFFLKNYQQLLDSNSILPRYYLKKLQSIYPDLYEQYENDRTLKFKTRSSHEIYAKYIIDESKSSQASEFREYEPEVLKESTHKKSRLLNNRDEYHRIKQSKGD
nr:MAG: replication initiator protein [Microvirus sp.]